MRKIIYISVLLMSFLSAAQAQKKIIYEDTSLLQKDEPVISAPVEDEVTFDTTEVSTLLEESPKKLVDTSLYKNDLDLSYDSIKNWRSQDDYAYAKYLDSLLKNLKKEPEQKKEEIRPRGGFLANLLGSGFFQVLLWAVAICFVLFILYRLFLTDGAFKRKSKAADNAANVEEEIITNESDFDRLIRQALQNSNYRQAVRYQYLRTLHLLATKGMVNLAPDKTNFNYVSEITNRSYQDAFAALTLNYEYVWYGEFDIDKNIYDKIENNFSNLNKKV
jgi:uncharacterized membrane protein